MCLDKVDFESHNKELLGNKTIREIISEVNPNNIF